MQPTRVKLLEALLYIGEPLSAREFVGVFDGELSMWEAEQHLRASLAFGLVEVFRGSTGRERGREDGFDVPYRLADPEADEDD